MPEKSSLESASTCPERTFKVVPEFHIVLTILFVLEATGKRTGENWLEVG
jgi:hypothetical protein